MKAFMKTLNSFAGLGCQHQKLTSHTTCESITCVLYRGGEDKHQVISSDFLFPNYFLDIGPHRYMLLALSDVNCRIFQVKLDLFKMVARKDERDRRRPTLWVGLSKSNLSWECSLNPINISECFAEQRNDFFERKLLSISTIANRQGNNKNNFLVYE